MECCEPVPTTGMEMVEMPHIHHSEIFYNLVIPHFFCLGKSEYPEMSLI
jgi:hypothetical protein